jgi:hypothetical protein
MKSSSAASLTCVLTRLMTLVATVGLGISTAAAQGQFTPNKPAPSTVTTPPLGGGMSAPGITVMPREAPPLSDSGSPTRSRSGAQSSDTQAKTKKNVRETPRSTRAAQSRSGSGERAPPPTTQQILGLPNDVKVVRIPNGLAEIIKVFGDNPRAWKELQGLRERLRDGPLRAGEDFGGSDRHNAHAELDKLRERLGARSGPRQRDEEAGRSGMLAGLPGGLPVPFTNPTRRAGSDATGSGSGGGFQIVYTGRTTSSGGTANFFTNPTTGSNLSTFTRRIPENEGGGTYNSSRTTETDGSEDRNELFLNDDGTQRAFVHRNYGPTRTETREDGSTALVRDYTGFVINRDHPQGRTIVGTEVIATARETEHNPQTVESRPKDSQPTEERTSGRGSDNCGWRPFLGCTHTWAVYNPSPGGQPGPQGPEGDRATPASVIGSSTAPGPGAATNPDVREGTSVRSGGGPINTPGPGPDPGRPGPDGPPPPVPGR